MTTSTLPRAFSEGPGESEFGGRRVLGYMPNGHPIFPITGSDPSGYNTQGDIVTETIDGRPLNAMWDEFHATLDIINNQRTAMTNLLGFRTVATADAVAQTLEDDEFEMATEFGEPTGIRSAPELLRLGYPFRDFDRAARFTWRFLRDASAQQVEDLHRRLLHADNKLTTTSILGRLMVPTASVNENDVIVYGLYNGDAQLPPRSGFNTFTDPHTHYLTTGTAEPDGSDLDDLARHITHHGYGTTPGSQLLLFVNTEDVGSIAAIRAGDSGAKHDFIPSAAAPTYLTTEQIVGSIAPAEFGGLQIAGSYGNVFVAPSEFMPPGYLLMAASGGSSSGSNPVGFREHVKPEAQGLRLLPGNQSGYPLVDSYYTRGFGVGVRHRGAAAVMQITAATTYSPPPAFAGVVL